MSWLFWLGIGGVVFVVCFFIAMLAIVAISAVRGDPYALG